MGLSATKQEIRKHVWSLMEKASVARFPKPIFGRIPNFESAEEAAAKLRELKDFSDAKAVKVSPAVLSIRTQIMGCQLRPLGRVMLIIVKITSNEGGMTR